MVFIFDMDGVIVDNLQYHVEAWNEFGKRRQFFSPETDHSKYFGLTNQMIFRKLFGDAITDAEITALSNEKEALYREIYSLHIKPLPGLPAFIEALRQAGCRTAIATAGPMENVLFTIEKCGIAGSFDLITDASLVTHSKPDPEVYLVTASRLGVQPAECIVFEDSYAGIQSAKAAGMRVIGVCTTHTAAELQPHTADIIMDFTTSNPVIVSLLEQITGAAVHKPGVNDT